MFASYIPIQCWTKKNDGPQRDPPRDCNTSNTEVHELGLQSNFPAGGWLSPLQVAKNTWANVNPVFKKLQPRLQKNSGHEVESSRGHLQETIGFAGQVLPSPYSEVYKLRGTSFLGTWSLWLIPESINRRGSTSQRPTLTNPRLRLSNHELEIG